jgi:hypothetical protein
MTSFMTAIVGRFGVDARLRSGENEQILATAAAAGAAALPP